MMDKLGLREWLAKEEETTLEWSDKFITGLAKEDKHGGDCTKMPCSCSLCTLESLLSDYREYFFNNR